MLSRETGKEFIVSLGPGTLWVIALVFMFVSRTRFPVNKIYLMNVVQNLIFITSYYIYFNLLMILFSV